MSNSTVSNKDRVVCKKCKSLTVITFKFCQNCGIENSSLISAPVSRTCTSFNDLDFNIITLVTTFIHSKYKPLKAYFSDDTYTAEQFNAEDVELGVLFSLNTHYRRYKAKNYFFYLNKLYSLKYYSNDNNFSLKMNIDNPLQQLGLFLEEVDIEDVSVLGNVNVLDLSKNSRVKDVSALGSVHTLHLTGCTGITDVSSLGSVHDLSLSNCTSLTSIRHLASVVKLDISYCLSIEEVIDMPSVTHTKSIGCSELRVLRNLPKLESLDAQNCINLVEVSGVSDDFSHLNISGCSKMKEVNFLKRKIVLV